MKEAPTDCRPPTVSQYRSQGFSTVFSKYHPLLPYDARLTFMLLFSVKILIIILSSAIIIYPEILFLKRILIELSANLWYAKCVVSSDKLKVTGEKVCRTLHKIIFNGSEVKWVMLRSFLSLPAAVSLMKRKRFCCKDGRQQQMGLPRRRHRTWRNSADGSD